MYNYFITVGPGVIFLKSFPENISKKGHFYLCDAKLYKPNIVDKKYIDCETTGIHVHVPGDFSR